MKKLLVLLSVITASTAYSVVSTKLDVNATLVKPLSIVADAKYLYGSISNAGGKVVLSKVGLTVTGDTGANVRITALKDITFTQKAGGQTVTLMSKFSTESKTVGKEVVTDLKLSSLGEVETTYNIEGDVPATITTTGGKAEFEADTDISVAYN